MRRLTVLLPVLLLLSGCPVTQPQDTPVDEVAATEPRTGRSYWLYLPSCYKADRKWPLVITLHGTHGWDSRDAQIREWKSLAEREGLIVASPQLRSVQGILPVSRELWRRDLDADEQAILGLLDDLCARYEIDQHKVLLTGFSAGGYPLYFVGLRNPRRFDMLIARACNSSIDLFESVELTDEARALPILIFWGKDDLTPLREQSWAAFRYLREHGFRKADKDETKGGHLRRPEVAYRAWRKRLPPEYRPE